MRQPCRLRGTKSQAVSELERRGEPVTVYTPVQNVGRPNWKVCVDGCTSLEKNRFHVNNQRNKKDKTS